MVQRIGKYKVLEAIRASGLGVIYKALDPQLNRLVALKVTELSFQKETPDFAETYLREARIIARLHHPHIATIYEGGEEDGELYIVTELAEASLGERLEEQGALSEEEALEILEQTASALDCIHAQGLVHRDIKPFNILLSSEKGVLLYGFLIGFGLYDNTASTSTDSIIGTPSYLAPEIWRGQQPTPATDVFALGCVLYEMLTGQMLFEGDFVAITKLHEEGVRLLEWTDSALAGANVLLQKALAGNPEERYQSATELAQGFRALVEARDNPQIWSGWIYGQAQKAIERAGEELDLSGQGLTALPPKVGQLADLRVLRLYDNRLTALPPEIGQLTSLESLDLSDNQLTALPSEIGQLTHLQQLDLTNNALAELPLEIGYLSNLQQFDLKGNQLTALPSTMVQLANLQRLDIRDNPLPIPAEILEQVSDTSSRELSPATFSRVQETLLRSGAFSSMTDRRGVFSDSRISPWRNRLDLAGAPAVVAASAIALLSSQYNASGENALVLLLHVLLDYVTVDLDQEELIALASVVEAELASGGTGPTLPHASAILSYYFELERETRALNEVKVLLVGQGGAGKTCLANRLVADTFNPDEAKTDGIAVSRWRVPLGDEQIHLNLWDFGGQEIMHATHQFFLTRRSLYLLVIDARAGERESNLEYWLQIIHSFGGDSPVIIVTNKVDEHPLELNRKGLRDKYPTIHAFVDTSCKDNTGIGELEQCIIREVEHMEHIRSVWLKSWFKIKIRLEGMDRDYITYDEYVQMCQDMEIGDPESQRVLIGYLHDLGIVLSYRDDPRLEETNILNPEWITSAVYRILNARPLFDSKGVLDRHRLGHILDRRRYPRDKHDFILGMMRKFELCFPLDSDRDGLYLIPDLLSIKEPDLGWPEPHACLNFHYRYHILPSSIITRFIVRMHDYIQEDTVWRTGVLLTYQDNQALVKADLEARHIAISVTGNPHTRREFLAIIRSHFDHIHRTISRIEIKELIPIPGHPGVFEEYQHLLTLERKGLTTFLPRGMEDLVEVKPLLDGIEAPEMRGAFTGIPPALEERLRRALLATGLFEDQAELGAIFVNDLISPWSDRVPQAAYPAARAQALIHALHDQYRSDSGENALILLLRVLATHIDPAVATHQELRTVSNMLATVLVR